MIHAWSKDEQKEAVRTLACTRSDLLSCLRGEARGNTRRKDSGKNSSNSGRNGISHLDPLAIDSTALTLCHVRGGRLCLRA